MSTLAEITQTRLTLAELRQRQRDCKRELDEAEARLALQVEGRNAEERKARLVLALAADAGYQAALRHHERTTLLIEHNEAALDEYRDARREWEWAVRLRLAEALERQAVPSDRPGDDESIDDAADELLTRRAA
jgi:hypothetical protein